MKLSPEYQAALDYIYQFVDFSMTKGQVFTPDTFDLSRMKALLDALDNPQLKFPVIHIAGSKGKGSTAAMIASVLRASGYSVGLYTSPHMIDFNERIQINGVPISHQSFVSLLENNKSVIESVEQITTFEVATALAFQYFADAAVDIAVIEVGLGGRLDATNLVQPLLTIITSISLDHTAILGDTLEKIAFEKGGIIKPGVPVVLAHQGDTVLKNLKLLAAERGSPILSVDEMLHVNQNETDIHGQAITVQYLPDIPPELKLFQEDCIQIWLPLVGKHQMENAGTAFLALGWMVANGYAISIEMLLRGFQETDWPGRFEVVSENPLIIVDSAHNPDSAQRLSETIQELLPGKNVCMILGASEDKDVEKMISAFRGTINHFIFTESTHPRAMAVGQLEKIGEKLGVSYESSLPIELVVSKICSTLPSNDVCIATGSVFIAAAVKEEILKICPMQDSTI